jgi:hypothetical protein
MFDSDAHLLPDITSRSETPIYPHQDIPAQVEVYHCDQFLNLSVNFEHIKVY